MPLTAPLAGKAIITSVGGLAAGSMAGSNPVIQGTADANSVVMIYDGVRLIGSALSTADGTWSFSPTMDMKGGSHVIRVLKVESDGSYAAASEGFATAVAPVVVSAPVIGDISHAVAEGHVAANGVTTDTHPVISGTGTPGDTVRLFDNATLIGSALVDAGGNWSVQPVAALAEGAHALSATQTSPGGTTGDASGAWHFTVDTSVPAAPVIGGMTNDDGLPIIGGITNDPHPTINGTGTAGDTVTVYDGDTPIGSVVIGGDGTWSFTPTTDLGPGTHDIVVIETNPAGTPSAQTDPITVVIDVSVPSTPVIGGMTNDDGLPIIGGITNDPHPTINGTGTAGDTVTVYDGDTPIGSVVIGGDGTWSFTPSTDLGPGTHDIVVIETNPAGTPSAQTDPITVVIDVSVPSTPVIGGMTNDDGLPIIGGITNDPHPTINGTGTAGDTVTVYDGDTPIGSVVIGGDGTWSFTPTTDLGPGTHDIVVIETNPAGTPSAQTDPITVVIDVSVPSTPVINGMTNDDGLPIIGGITNDPHPTINGTGTAGDTVTVYDGDKPIGSVVIGGDGTWSFTPTTDLGPGTHDIVVIETNPAGTPSAQTDPITVVIDTSVPAAPVIGGMTNDDGLPIIGGITNDPHPTINGTGTAGDTVTVYDGDTPIGSVVIGGDGTWSFTPSTDLGPGTHDIVVIETNPAGTPSAQTDPITVVIDVSVPSTPVIGGMTNDDGLPIIGGITNDPHPTINGTGTAGDTVTVYDGDTPIGSVVIGGDGTWSFTPTTDLGPGTHDIVVIETNPAGTPSAQTDPITVVIDTSVPAAPVINGMTNDDGLPIIGGITNDPHPTINGTGTAGDTVTVYDGDTPIGSVVIGGDGTWSFTPTTDLGPGTHDIVVIETNPAGTPSAQTDPITVVIDTSVPAAPVINGMTDQQGHAITGDATGDPHPTISGTGTPGDVVTMFDGNTQIGSVVVGQDGNWSLTPNTDLALGTHDITVIETNTAGTSSAPSEPFPVVYLPLPAAPVTAGFDDETGSIRGILADGAITDAATTMISGTGTAGDVIKMYDGAKLIGSATVDATGHWTMPPATLADGPHTLYVTESNASGESPRAAQTAITVDTSVPAAPVIVQLTDDVRANMTVAPGAVSESGSPHVSFTSLPGATVYIYDGATLLVSGVVETGSSEWILPPLTNGDHTLTIRQTNAAGTAGPASSTFAFTVNTTPVTPVIEQVLDAAGGTKGAIAANGFTDDKSPTISGSGTQGEIVKVYDSATLIGSAIVDTTGHWSVKPSSPLSDGTHGLTAFQVNKNGLTSAGATQFVFTIDTSVPVAPAISGVTDAVGAVTGPVPNGGTMDDTKPSISGKGVAGDTVQVYDGATLLGSALIDAAGNWTIHSTVALADGTHTLTAVDLNRVGTPSAASAAYTVTVDTTTPAAPSILLVTDAVGEQTGPVASGATTDDTRPVVNGTGHAGDIIKLFDGAIQIGSGIVGADGKWSIHPAVELPNGAHTLTAVEANLAGTPSAASEGFSFVVDSNAPAAPVILSVMDATGPVTGTVPAGGTTDETKPVVSGTGTAGDTIRLFDGDTLLGSAVADVYGRWSIAIPNALATGDHSLNAVDTNAIGTPSAASAPYDFAVDTSPPGVPAITSVKNTTGFTAGDVAANGTTGGTQPLISGTGHAGDTVKVFDGATLIGSALVDSAGAWSVLPAAALSSAVHDLTAVSTNQSGLTGNASSAFHFTIDTTAPPPVDVYNTLQDTMRSGQWVYSGGTMESVTPIVYCFSTIPGNTVHLYDGDTLVSSIYVTGTSGSLKFPPLPNGFHTLTVTQTNALGVESAPLTYTVIINMVPDIPSYMVLTDTVGPITGAVAAGATIDDTQPTLRGVGTRGEIIFVYDGGVLLGSVAVDGAANWSFKPSTPLLPGQHDFYALQKNSYGMLSPASQHIAFVLDPGTPAAPVIEIVQQHTAAAIGSIAPGSTTDDAAPTVSGHGAAGHIIKLYDGSTLVGSAVIDPDGAWSVPVAKALGAGTHTFTVTETSLAGPVSAASAGFAFTVADPAPVAPLIANVSGTIGSTGVTLANGDATNATKPAVSGTSTAGHTVTLYDHGAAIGSALVDASGKWTLTPANALAAGLHALTVIDTAPGGKASLASAEFDIMVETAAAAPPAITSLVAHDGSGTVPVAANGSTYDATPVVSGTGHVGDTVTVYDGSTSLGTAKVSGSGNWTFQLPAGSVTAGSHSLNATSTNSTGTPSAVSAAFAYTFAVHAPPAAPTLYLAKDPLHPSGYLLEGYTSESNQPVITYSSLAAGNTMNVYESGKLIATYPIAIYNTDRGDFTMPVLADGAHQLVFSQVTPDGVSADSPVFHININTSPSAPTSVQAAQTVDGVTSAITAAHITLDTHPVISGKGTVTQTVMIYDGATLLGSAVVNGSGNWSFKPTQPLSTGSHDITVKQVNSLGVSSAASAHFAFGVDPNPPSAPVIASVIDSLGHGTEFVPPGGGSTDTSPVVHGRGVSGHIVTLYDHDALVGSALVDGTGNWTITPASPFTNGTHALIATETNPNNGTTSVASNEFDVVIGGGVVQSVHSVDTIPADTGAAVADTSIHTVLHSHEAFVGTGGHQTIDLAMDPNAYFRESTAHIEGAKGGVDVLALVGDHQVLDLTSLTGATGSAKLSGVEVFDLGGHSNTLKLSLVDVLNLGETDMFQLDGNQQVMVNGKAGDSVDLSNTHIAGLKEGEWQAHGTAHVGGIEYNVFEHSSAQAELLVQQGIQTIVH